jgi:hypothetical protein
MVNFTSLLLLLATCLVSLADRVPKKYIINLADPPISRWKEVHTDLASDIKELATSYSKNASPEVIQAYSKILERGYYSSEIQEELRGMAMYANITYEEAVWLNFMYEFNAKCTSIVLRKKDGTVIHGRNLDYGYSELLQRTAIMADFYKGDEYIFSLSGFGWYLGVGTGIKPGAFTVTLNQRRGNYLETLLALVMGNKGNHLEIRKALTELNTYQDAFELLSTDKVVAPSYDIMSGPTSGSVITRNRFDSADIRTLNDTVWYLVETNYDWWKPTPPHDDRTTPAIKFLEEHGQDNMNEETLFQLLSTPPMYNWITVFTTVMNVQTGTMKTVVRGEAERVEIA